MPANVPAPTKLRGSSLQAIVGDPPGQTFRLASVADEVQALC